LWPRMASRAMANTEYFFNVPASRQKVSRIAAGVQPASEVYH